MFSIELELTRSCNLACKYCFEDKKNHNSSIDFEQAVERIEFGIERARKLKQSGVSVDFTGGEPLLQFKLIKEIVDYIEKTYGKEFEFRYGLVTNGTLFSEEIAEYCSRHGFSINLSLDGTQFSHDVNRILKSGESSYSLIMKNIDNFINYNKNVVINIVINSKTYDKFYENLTHVISLGFKEIRTAIDLTHQWTNEEMQVLQKEFEKSADYYFNLNKNGQKAAWNFIEDGIRHILKPPKHYYCGAGVISVFLDVQGNLKTCSVCEKDINTNIGTLADGIDENKLQSLRHYKRQLQGKCVNCEINKFCSQCDCIFINKTMTGDYHTVPEQYCFLSKVQYALCNDIIKRMDLYRKEKKNVSVE